MLTGADGAVRASAQHGRQYLPHDPARRRHLVQDGRMDVSRYVRALSNPDFRALAYAGKLWAVSLICQAIQF